jgi:hypothetical protein
VTMCSVRPARGHLKYCAECGASIIFVEERQPKVRGATPPEAVMAAIAAHKAACPRCRQAETFDGGDLVACRCARVIPLGRLNGLWCARCNGRVAPAVAAYELPGNAAAKGEVP